MCFSERQHDTVACICCACLHQVSVLLCVQFSSVSSGAVVYSISLRHIASVYRFATSWTRIRPRYKPNLITTSRTFRKKTECSLHGYEVETNELVHQPGCVNCEGQITHPPSPTATPHHHRYSFCSGMCPFRPNISHIGLDNLTVYRITPWNVTDMGDHDTGDAAGDLGFLLSKYMTNSHCSPPYITEDCFLDDFPIVASFPVTFDATYGPYVAHLFTDVDCKWCWHC